MKKNNIWKWGVVVLAVCLIGLRACAQTVDVKVRVLDQDGKPLAGVNVDSESQAYLRKKDNVLGGYDAVLTNEKGMAVIKSRKRSMTERIYLKKEGYYETRSITLSPIAQDYPPKEPVELTIKKIKKPVAMFAKSFKIVGLGKLSIPIVDKEIGYDLMVGDWVAPHGKGRVADFIFLHQGVKRWSGPKHHREEYEQKITLRFSNEKDGIIVYKSLSEGGWKYGSEFVSDYEAPLSGYQPEWVQRTWKERGGSHQTTLDRDRNFYFRVRTEVDEKGNIVSAHYGKIYGDFMSFIYYINPTANDRNVEFDLKKNLFPKEKVVSP